MNRKSSNRFNQLKITEVGEDSVELVGDFADEIEELGNPFKIGFVAQGEDADMWRIWMVVKKRKFLRRQLKMLN